MSKERLQLPKALAARAAASFMCGVLPFKTFALLELLQRHDYLLLQGRWPGVLIPFLMPTAGLLLGILALRKIHRPTCAVRGTELAVAGIVLSFAWLALFAFLSFFFFGMSGKGFVS